MDSITLSHHLEQLARPSIETAAEMAALGALLHHPDWAYRHNKLLRSSRFTHPHYQAVARIARAMYWMNDHVSIRLVRRLALEKGVPRVAIDLVLAQAGRAAYLIDHPDLVRWAACSDWPSDRRRVAA